MPERATAALTTSLAKTCPKLCRCFFVHSFSPPYQVMQELGTAPCYHCHLNSSENRHNCDALLIEEGADLLSQHCVLIQDAVDYLLNPADL